MPGVEELVVLVEEGVEAGVEGESVGTSAGVDGMRSTVGRCAAGREGVFGGGAAVESAVRDVPRRPVATVGGMGADLRRASGAITALIVMVTVMLAFTVHWPANAKVAIAVVGLLIALVVRDRLVVREYRVDHGLDVRTGEPEVLGYDNAERADDRELADDAEQNGHWERADDGRGPA